MFRKLKEDVTTTKKTSRFKMQPRDQRIVYFAAAHGYVTMPQTILFAFENWDEWGKWKSVSEQAVYRRLKTLCEAACWYTGVPGTGGPSSSSEQVARALGFGYELW